MTDTIITEIQVTCDRGLCAPAACPGTRPCAWHPEFQWLLDAHDLDKQADRTFAVRDVLEVLES